MYVFYFKLIVKNRMRDSWVNWNIDQLFDIKNYYLCYGILGVFFFNRIFILEIFIKKNYMI